MVPEAIVDPWSVLFRVRGTKRKWECWDTYEGPQMAQQVFEVLTHGRVKGLFEHRVERGWGAQQAEDKRGG